MSSKQIGADYVVRTAIVADAAIIAYHRMGMFRDMGLLSADECPGLEEAAHAYLTTALRSGEYLGWVVEMNGEVVAGGGALIRRMLPRPGFSLGGEEAYVLNVYTEPEHRRRGLARRLMAEILAWCELRGIPRVTLHASDEGRPLYESLGFTQTNEMRLENLTAAARPTV